MSGQPKWTRDQQRALDARGHTVLVSAAAGSGKTAVLTERAVRRMLDPADPISADRLLVVTFTRDAAREMKQRMVKKLAERIAADPADPAPRRQRQLLDRALIGTIDSLCLELLRQNWQQLGLPAAFRVGDSQELSQMREEAVGAALEAAYAADTPAFRQLAALLAERRGDQSLSDTVLRVLDFARTHPFYLGWLDSKLKLYEEFPEPASSVWGQILTEYAAELAERLCGIGDAAVGLIGKDPEFENYLPAFSGDREFLSRLSRSLAAREWDGTRSLLHSYAPVRLGRLKKGVDPGTQQLLKRQRERIKDGIARLRDKIFSAGLADFREDIDDLTPKLRYLFALVRETDGLLQNQKRQSGVFDFSDLEQFAAGLLMQPEGEGFSRTPLALELGEKFDEIMVDEYQDVNAVQDMIINALSDGRNLFLVGDVKQSIYRFRQAQPEIFLRRSERYRGRPRDLPGAPELITLGGNFRSRQEITGAVNRIFEPLMSRRIGELVYDENHRLEAMADFPPDGDAGMRMLLLETGGLSADGALAAEAKTVAGEIRALLDGNTMISDGGTLRPLVPGDIAVLLRSPRGRAELFRQALDEQGIEAFTRAEGGFLTTREIASMLCLLRALRNPTLDIELIGAMLSPLFGFTDDEIAAIRLVRRKVPFFTALTEAAEQGGHPAEFLETFEALRRRALTVSAAQLITEIYARTGFDLLCRAMPGGKQRFANLSRLAQIAGDYHQRGFRGLTMFLRVIDRLTERGEELPAAYVGEGSNAVTITSIHSSKGLEWPVVFLADAGRRHSFYRHDLNAPTILHSELGFACVRRDEVQKKQFATVPLEAVRLESERAMLSEELRVLYVAMTRAKERLIVTAALKKAGEQLDGYDADARSGPLSPAEVREGHDYASWILMALARQGSLSSALRFEKPVAGVRLSLGFLEEKRQAGSTREPRLSPGFPGGERQAGSPQEAQLSLFEKQAPPPAEADEALAEELVRRAAFSYPCGKAAQTPAKLAVSALTHPQGGENRFLAAPAFLGRGTPGSERGSAAHAFMQYCDYRAAATDPSAELSRLREQGILSVRQADLVDLRQIEAFFQSSLAERIFSAGRVLREFAFMVPAERCPSVRGLAAGEGESPMLQGIADCIFFEEDSAVLIDYKTDRVKEMSVLAERYRGQLSLYREMLAEVLPVPVRECRIWSFALGRETEVEFTGKFH